MQSPETPQPVKKIGATAVTFAVIGSIIPFILLCIAIFWITGGTDPTPAEDLLFLAIVIAMVVGPSLLAAIVVAFALRKKRPR